MITDFIALFLFIPLIVIFVFVYRAQSALIKQQDALIKARHNQLTELESMYTESDE